MEEWVKRSASILAEDGERLKKRKGSGKDPPTRRKRSGPVFHRVHSEADSCFLSLEGLASSRGHEPDRTKRRALFQLSKVYISGKECHSG